MAMSNAERQRNYRKRRDEDPEKRRKFLQRCKERYKKDRVSGKNKPIQSMSAREKRHIRKQWRIQKRKDRARAKTIREALRREPTPPSSPEEQNTGSQKKRHMKKKRKKEKSKCYRDNMKLKIEKENMKKKILIEMYKKRLQWADATREKTFDTPRSKTRKLLRHLSQAETKRCIFKYNVVIEKLRQKYALQRKREKADVMSEHNKRIQNKNRNIQNTVYVCERRKILVTTHLQNDYVRK